MHVTCISCDTVFASIRPGSPGAREAGVFMTDEAVTGIENLSQEDRTFSPPTEFVQNSVARPSLYAEA